MSTSGSWYPGPIYSPDIDNPVMERPVKDKVLLSGSLVFMTVMEIGAMAVLVFYGLMVVFMAMPYP